MESELHIDAKGTKRYYKNHTLHRLDGPAIECSNGDKEWYKEGKRHRLDGPAIEYPDGYKRWFIEGELVYDSLINNIHKFKLSNEMKRSIIEYRLNK